MTREEAKRYWTAKYEAAKKWDDPHWEAQERREHRKYVEALHMAIEALKAKTDGDIISRAEAIEAIESRYTEQWIESDIDYNSGLESALCEIKALPSAEPKTGNWVLDPNGMDWNIPAWRCSECGFVANYIGVEANGLGNNPMNWAGSKFCPNCGARMRGEGSE